MIFDRKANAVRRGQKIFGAALALAAGAPCAVYAQHPVSIMSTCEAGGDRDTSADTELLLAGGDVIVTASRTVQRISDSPAAATVITADQIERSGATSIIELLRSVPGVDVMEPNKSQANVAIRGFNNVFANKVLVLVDGRSINDDIEGNIFWNTEPLLMSRIARIEIVRGPGSVLYGADAFGGVINIITKTPQELLASGKRTSATSAYGEHNSTFIEAVNTQGKAGDWAVTVGAGYHGTDGFGDRGKDNVRDSSRVPILTVDAQKQLSRGSLTFSANNSDAIADLSVQTMLADAKWHTNSQTLTYSEDKGAAPIMARLYRTSIVMDGDIFTLKARAVNLELQQQRRLSDRHQLLYGVSYRQGEYFCTPIGASNHTQTLSSVFLQDQFQIDAATNLFAGVRWDQNSTYSSQVSPRLSLVHHLPKDQTIRLSYGTAFRAPTLMETYLNFSSPIAPGLDFTTLGSDTLKPEKVSSIEAGYRKEFTGGYAGINLFYNHITDIIGASVTQFAPAPYPAGIPTVVQYMNQGGASAVGLEVDSSFSLGGGAHALLNYAYQNVTDPNGQQVDFSPHHKINLAFSSDERRRTTAYLAAHFVGTAQQQPVTLRAYTTVDAKIGYRVSGANNPWTLSLGATNLLDDRHYEYVDTLGTSTGKNGESQRRTLWLRMDGKF